MKLLVKTTGNFMLVAGNADIPDDRPAVIVNTGMIQSLMAQKKLKIVLTDLPGVVTDKDFLDIWAKFNATDKQREKKAISAFKKAFLVEAEPDEDEEDKTTPAEPDEKTPPPSNND